MAHSVIQSIPLLRGLLPYLGGVIVALFTPYLEMWSVGLAGLVWLAILGLTNQFANQRYRWAWLAGAVLIAGFAMLGFLRVHQVDDQHEPMHFGNKASQEDKVLLKLLQRPKPADQSVKLKTEVIGIWRDGNWLDTHGKLLAYIDKDDAAEKLDYGDVILTENNFEPLEPPDNPEQFNRKAFLSNQQIYQQTFLDSSKWTNTGINEGNAAFKIIYDIRHQCLTWLSKAVNNQDAYAVAAALLAGYKAEIDPDLRSSYASTGAMHVLAVSGLHVGIIYLMLSYGLSFLNALPRGRFIKLGVIVLLLWIYACVTGLPSSVIRACTMFSFVAIGSNLQRVTNIYGSITASLFLLLLINPYLLTQVGFQLSYAAVLGIVFLQPRLYNLFPKSRYWLVDKIWAITAVSIAAQLSTFPLTLFYFNQFPTYFMISNLVVIPAAMLIVPTGFIFFLLKTCGLDNVGYLAGTLLDELLRHLNFLIGQVEALPYSLIDQLYISTPTFYLIYLMIIGFSIGLIFRYKTMLFTGMIAAIAVLGLINYQQWQQRNLQKLAYLKIDNATVLANLGASKAILKGPPSVLKKENQVKFFTYRFLWSNGLKKSDIQKKPIPDKSSKNPKNFYDTLDQTYLATIRDKRILLASEPLYWPDTSTCKLDIDHLLLTDDKALEPQHVKKYLRPELVVLGYELAPWTIDKWEKAEHRASFNCYNLQEAGALVKNL